MWRDFSEPVRNRPDRTQLGRTLLLLAVCGIAAFIALALRLYIVQIRDHDKLESLAIEQQMKSVSLPAERGTIRDRQGKALAENATAYSVYICPFEQKLYEEPEEEVVSLLSSVLSVAPESVSEKLSDSSRWYQTVRKKIDSETAQELRLLISGKGLRCIHVEEDTKRVYPYGSLACHVLGFSGADGNGLEGVEAVYDSSLTGKNGSVSRLASADGRKMIFREYETVDPGEPGADVNLTLDIGVQLLAEKALDQAIADHNVQKGGACLVMNIRTGELLALASREDYDLNDYLAIDESLLNPGEDESEQRKNLRLKQWRNKAVSDTYEPGSVFKILTLAMGLDTGIINENSQFYCGGSTLVPGRGKPLKCWKTSGHGSQNLTESAQHSCNVAFCQIGLRLGADTFYQYAEKFGLFRKTGIDLPGEAGSQWWSREVFCSETNLSQLAAASFGQTFTITPLQLSAAIAAVCNGGTTVKPHVVSSVISPEKGETYRFTYNGERVIMPETSRTVNAILEQVVGGEGGTGRNAYVPGYRIGGKTGTSEKVAQDAAGGEKEYIVSFCGLAPMPDPEVLVLLLLDTPDAATGHYISGGVMAAPAVGSLFSELLPYLGYERELTEEEKEYVNVTVPELVGMTAKEAEKMLSELGLSSERIGEGERVLSQLPMAGGEILSGSRLFLYTTEPEEDRVTVPELSGKNGKEAQTALENAGLSLCVQGAYTGNGEALACYQSIPAGETVLKGSIVSVTFRDNTDNGLE